MKWNLSWDYILPKPFLNMNTKLTTKNKWNISFYSFQYHSWFLLALCSMQSLVILLGGQDFLDLIDHNANIFYVRNICEHSCTSRCRSKCFCVSWCSHRMMFIRGRMRMGRLCWVAWLGIYPFDARRSCSIIKESGWLGRIECAISLSCPTTSRG